MYQHVVYVIINFTALCSINTKNTRYNVKRKKERITYIVFSSMRIKYLLKVCHSTYNNLNLTIAIIKPPNSLREM